MSNEEDLDLLYALQLMILEYGSDAWMLLSDGDDAEYFEFVTHFSLVSGRASISEWIAIIESWLNERGCRGGGSNDIDGVSDIAEMVNKVAIS